MKTRNESLDLTTQRSLMFLILCFTGKLEAEHERIRRQKLEKMSNHNFLSHFAIKEMREVEVTGVTRSTSGIGLGEGYYVLLLT